MALQAPIAPERLQRLVDSLANRLSLPVLIEDADLRPLAYSAHGMDAVDEVRAASILNRIAPEQVAEYLGSLGISEARGPVRLPANPGIGFEPRICSPVISEGRLIGYLWVIDDPGRPADAADLDLISQVTEGAAPLLLSNSRRQHQLQVEARIGELLSTDSRLSCDAAARLLDAGEFSPSAHVGVMVAKVTPPPGERIDETVTVLLNRGVHAFGRGMSARLQLSLTRGDHAIFVAGDEDGGSLADRIGDLGESLRRLIAAAAPDPTWEVAVGIGSVVRSLAGAGRSFTQASQASSVAGRLADADPVIKWEDMGIYRLLAPPPDETLDTATLPAGIQRLLDHPGGEMLLHTLETYLDRGGDAQATTAELFLARGSLYYRLHRIEEIAEVSLRSGHDRLMLHVGLKLARIGGLYPSQAVDDRALVEAG